jgi:hypothetical protein
MAIRLAIYEGFPYEGHGTGCRAGAILECGGDGSDVDVVCDFLFGTTPPTGRPSFVRYLLFEDVGQENWAADYDLISRSYTNGFELDVSIYDTYWKLYGTGWNQANIGVPNFRLNDTFMSITGDCSTPINSSANEFVPNQLRPGTHWYLEHINTTDSPSYTTGRMSGILFLLMHKQNETWNFFDACAAVRSTCLQHVSVPIGVKWDVGGYGYGLVQKSAAMALNDKMTLPLYPPANTVVTVFRDKVNRTTKLTFKFTPFAQSRATEVRVGLFLNPPSVTSTLAEASFVYTENASHEIITTTNTASTYYAGYFTLDSAGNASILEPFAVVGPIDIVEITEQEQTDYLTYLTYLPVQGTKENLLMSNIFVDNESTNVVQSGASWADCYTSHAAAISNISAGGDELFFKATDTPYVVTTALRTGGGSVFHFNATGVGTVCDDTKRATVVLGEGVDGDSYHVNDSGIDSPNKLDSCYGLNAPDCFLKIAPNETNTNEVAYCTVKIKINKCINVHHCTITELSQSYFITSDDPIAIFHTNKVTIHAGLRYTFVTTTLFNNEFMADPQITVYEGLYLKNCQDVNNNKFTGLSAMFLRLSSNPATLTITKNQFIDCAALTVIADANVCSRLDAGVNYSVATALELTDEMKIGISCAAIHEQATPATDLDGKIIHFLPPSVGPYDEQGDTKRITSDYLPTGYCIRRGANVVLDAHGLSVDFTGLTLDENDIKVKEVGPYRVHNFTRKAGTNQYVYGANPGGGVFGGIFG